MSQVPEFKDLEPVDQMIEVLMAAGPFAYGKEARLQQTAEEWLAENFDLETAFAWLTVAGCFDAATAAKLSAAGISPEIACRSARSTFIWTTWLLAISRREK